MERPHVATQYFLPILLPFAEIPEPRAGQAGNGKADSRLSSGQAGVHQEPDDYRVLGAFRQYRFYGIEILLPILGVYKRMGFQISLEPYIHNLV